MTTEEKAKAYDEALKIASSYYGNKHLDAEKLLEKLFPKLAESGEERIRKKLFAILEWAKCYGDCGFTPDEVKEVIAYLEKQEEQKQGIKVRIPKFRVGDIIQRIPLETWDSTKKITSIDEHGYNYNLSHLGDTVSGGAIGFAFEDEYELVEQKPADNISKEEYVKRFKALCDAYEIKLPNREYDIYHLCDDLSKLSIDSGKQKPVEVKPRFKIGDTLKKKNKDYTFVVDKIQGGFYLTSDEHFFPIEEQDSWELLEQKPVEWNKATINGEPIPTENHSVNIPLAVWSEEDKKIAETICKEGDLKPSEKRWLKSLPERFNLQPKQEWSEDNIKELTKFEVAMLHIGMSFFGSSAGLNPNNTNEVKKQAKLLLELVPKQEWSEEDIKKIRSEEYTKGFNDAAFGGKLKEWSEEDEEMIHDIIDLLDSNLAASDFHEIENWLKSLPERFNLQPKQEWSEEDEALFELLHQCVCRCINDDRMDYSERDKISKTMIPFIEKLQTLHPQQQTICDEKHVPSREMILAIWELGHVWKETNPTGVTQREYIQKHWKESSYYDKLKSTNPQPHTVSIKDATKFGNLEYERGVKDGIQHVKNHQWKPSKEQMNGLAHAINLDVYDAKRYGLDSLYNDLNKLGVKEEESDYCQPFNPDC